MDIPAELEILGRSYKIVEMGALDAQEGTLGAAVYRAGEIHLDMDMDPSLMLKVLWHEIIHVAQQELHQTCDEPEARWISLFVHNFILQNPAILECYLDIMGCDVVPATEEGEAL